MLLVGVTTYAPIQWPPKTIIGKQKVQENSLIKIDTTEAEPLKTLIRQISLICPFIEATYQYEYICMSI